MAQELQFKWNGKELSVSAEPSETLEDVKRKLEQQTHVGAKRQKLLGLKTRDGKMAGDSALVADLAIKPGTRIMLMGCAAAAAAAGCRAGREQGRGLCRRSCRQGAACLARAGRALTRRPRPRLPARAPQHAGRRDRADAQGGGGCARGAGRL
jgi:hypothetical protein